MSTINGVMKELSSYYRYCFYEVFFDLELGFRCGYVKVPNDHPFYGKYYDEISDKIHTTVGDGLTFSDSRVGRPSDEYWIGFHCNYDYYKLDEKSLKKYLSNDKAERVIKIVTEERLRDNPNYNPTKDAVSLTECEDACKDLIDQLMNYYTN